MTLPYRSNASAKFLIVMSYLSATTSTNAIFNAKVEQDILIALYQNTAGERWTRNDNWNTSEFHYCDWQGISCISPETASRRLQAQYEPSVEQIDLADNNLQGSVPLSLLLLLPNIRSIRLNGNNVDYTKIAQQEKDTLGVVLDITNVTVLSNVQTLDLSQTSIMDLNRIFTTGNGSTIIHTPRLTDFFASQGQIRGPFPSFLMDTSSLQRLELDHNSLTGTLPRTLGNLQNLNYLNIAENSLDGTLPNTVNHLGKLRYLLAEKNAFTGTIPLGLSSVEYTPLLEQIDLSDQRRRTQDPGLSAGLSGKVPLFNSQKRLRRVDLGVNSFTGSVPSGLLSEITSSNFDFIDLSSNLLSGNVPASVIQRFSADSLFLDNNKITGVDSCPSSAFGCSAVLCPPLTFEPRAGRQEESSRPCLECKHNTKYWGQTECKIEENTPTAAPVPVTSKPTYAPANVPTTFPPTPAPVPSQSLTQSPSGAPNPVYVDEKDVLIEIYNATGGNQWTNSDGWSSSNDADTFCAWHGIICTSESNRSIQYLHLESNNLVGSLPTSIYSLPSLISVDVSHNADLTVTFTGIGNARSLEVLVLSSTKVNSIEGLIDAAESLQELHISDIGGFAGKSFPDDIFKLTNLRQLSMDYNNAAGTLSDEVGKLSKLVIFSAANNAVSGTLPTSIEKLTDLTSLRLTTNHFTGTLPFAFSMLTTLSVLDLSNQWSNGQDDDFESSGRAGLSGHLPSFAHYTQLRRIDLGVNSFSGSIPPDFLDDVDSAGGLFEFVDIGDNSLTGTVPSTMGRLTNAYMQGNMLTGIDQGVCDSLPAALLPFGCNAVLCSPGFYNQLGKQVSADKACSPCTVASDAQFYGSTECVTTAQIPNYPSGPPADGPSYASANDPLEQAALELIYDSCGGPKWSIESNWKQNDLSLCFWNGISCSPQSKVVGISLRAANLVGTFPTNDVVQGIPFLQSLVLDGNSIVFPFDGLEKAYHLETLDLTNTELDSADGLEVARTLKSIYIASNNLRGEFPTQLLQLTNLERVDVAFNSLSKTIPNNLTVLTRLEYLSLHDNDITGTIPASLGNLSNLVFLLLQANSISGSIPSEMNFLTKLRFLDLSLQNENANGDHGLIGKLPSFATLAELARINLSGNKLTGPIPFNFLDRASAQVLEHLDLSMNKLTGTVPSILDKFPAENYDVTNNQFSGINPSLCVKSLGGVIEAFGCDAVLCSKGAYNSKGRQILGTEKCESCPGNQFFGTTTCSGNSATPSQAPIGTPILSPFEVLSKFFDSTAGKSWRRNDHWKQADISVCEWFGITCSSEGQEQVTDVILSSNNLVGIVPHEIFLLPYLQSLVLDSNVIEMQNLDRILDSTQFETLDLSNTGIKDVDGIGKSRTLRELHIKSNNLEGSFPEEIFDILTLEQLDFDFCHFSGTLGSRIAQLTNLKTLAGDNNKLSGSLPSELGNLTNLVTMALGRNSFTGSIPSSLNSLSSITVIDLSDQTDHGGRGLSGELPALYSLSSLSKLILNSNAISGSLPINFLQGVNPEVFEYADISSNSIIGHIPSSLAHLPHLHLHDNLITGVATAMCSTSRGTIYKDYGCNAVLCPPTTYNPHGRQETASSICMSCKEATFWGTTACPPSYRTSGFPTDMNERDILVKFYEYCGGDSWNDNTNWMSTVSICTWFGIRCADGYKDGKIEVIELSANNIAGPPPSELFTLPSLTSLSLYSNPLKSVNFTGIEFALNLKELLLDETGISSVDGLQNAKHLEILNLRFNQLKNRLPSEIAALTTLQTLTMAYNGITGRLPTFFEKLTNLKSLLLSSNSFTGSLGELNFPSSLRRLDLSENELTGSIPNSFLTLVPFQAQLEIDLSENAFTGSLPTDLTRFNSLILYASDNHFSTIDSQLCSMSNWNDGDVGKYGCDAILCPAKYSALNGRHSSAGECQKCLKGGSEFMGSSSCGNASSANGMVAIYAIVSSISFLYTLLIFS